MNDAALATGRVSVSVSPTSPGPDAVDRGVDIALSGTLAVFPLLPAGPGYLGLTSTWWPEAALLVMAALALIAVLNARRTAAAIAPRAWPIGIRLVSRGYAFWILAMTGAAAIGLAAVNVVGSDAFVAELGDLPWRLFQPMNQASDSLYPLRVWLTMVEGAAAFWLVTLTVVSGTCPRRRARAALRGCICAVGLVSAIAVVQHQTGFGLHPYWVFMNPDLTRSHATLDDPNALGSFLVLSLGVVLAVMGSATRGWAGRRRRLGTAVLATLVVAALVTTVSRAALAALPLAGLVIAAVLPAAGHHSLRLRRLARTAFGGLVALLVVWLGARAVVEPRPTPLPGSAWQAVRQTLDPRTPIADVLKSRHLMWQAAGRMFVEAPALGVGLGQFPRLYARDTSGQRAENAHNFYLQTLAEGGLAGLLGLTLLVGSAWLALRPHLVGARRRPRALAAGFAVGLLAWLLTSVSGHPALTVSNQVWLGALLALAVTSVQPGSPDRRRNSAGRASAPRPASLRLKRAVDVTAALALLALLLPLMVFIAAIIRLDSRGPALFRHRRVTTRGANGRSNTTDRVEPRMFDFIKFRTMFDDVDPYEPSPTSPADPRVTRVGRLLRRTCLDELPQLWNVLKGDLSLVGPRPEMPWVVARYDASARRRFGAQPGVTGLWQLRGHRDRHIHDDIRWDLWYIRRRSLRLDMVILCETLFFVVGRRNH